MSAASPGRSRIVIHDGKLEEFVQPGYFVSSSIDVYVCPDM